MNLTSYFLIGALLGVICNIIWHQRKLNILRKEQNELLKSLAEETERTKELIKKFEALTKDILNKMKEFK